MLYEKPRIYILIHFLIGLVAVWAPILGLLALTWQLGQYAANIRIFAIEGKIESGNSAEHTGLKLIELGIGYCIGVCIWYLVKDWSTPLLHHEHPPLGIHP
jgi:hypothetical protein